MAWDSHGIEGKGGYRSRIFCLSDPFEMKDNHLFSRIFHFPYWWVKSHSVYVPRLLYLLVCNHQGRLFPFPCYEWRSKKQGYESVFVVGYGVFCVWMNSTQLLKDDTILSPVIPQMKIQIFILYEVKCVCIHIYIYTNTCTHTQTHRYRSRFIWIIC